MEFKSINEYETSFLSDLNTCNMTKFNSLYEICCGKTGIIECDEINMDLTFNNTYSFNVPGRITNLTMEGYEDNIKFTYSSD